MERIHPILLGIQIVFGFIVLFVFWLLIMMRKGGKLHRLNDFAQQVFQMLKEGV